jgi:hypothetical protein
MIIKGDSYRMFDWFNSPTAIDTTNDSVVRYTFSLGGASCALCGEDETTLYYFDEYNRHMCFDCLFKCAEKLKMVNKYEGV